MGFPMAPQSLIPIKQLKSVAYSSQGSHVGQLISATDWQMAARRENVVSITLRQVQYINFLNQIRYFSIK
jgi:hypothetical protein